MSPDSLIAAARSVLIESAQVYTKLLKVMVPTLLVVKLLQELGAVQMLGKILSPIMMLVGLPDVLGVVWAATLLTNVFTGALVFFEVTGNTSLSVEQVSILGTLMLIGHSLPVEGAVARRAGVSWATTIALRVDGALVLAAILHFIYSGLGVLQEPAQFLWRPELAEDTLAAWVLTQLSALVVIFFIILALIVLIRVLRRLGLERLIHLALTPLLRLLGIGRSAANVIVIGMALGMTFGAGLLIRDFDAGVMNRRDSYLAVCFLSLMHSLIDDTLLVMALGADVSAILWARLIFSMLVIAALARWTSRLDARGATSQATRGSSD